MKNLHGATRSVPNVVQLGCKELLTSCKPTHQCDRFCPPILVLPPMYHRITSQYIRDQNGHRHYVSVVYNIYIYLYIYIYYIYIIQGRLVQASWPLGLKHRRTVIVHGSIILPTSFKLLFCHSLLLQVFQAFSCEKFPEIGKNYLRADQSIECYTRTHGAFRIYAAVMIFLCELTG